jgi:hypothetical protein
MDQHHGLTSFVFAAVGILAFFMKVPDAMFTCFIISAIWGATA